MSAPAPLSIFYPGDLVQTTWFTGPLYIFNEVKNPFQLHGGNVWFGPTLGVATNHFTAVGARLIRRGAGFFYLTRHPNDPLPSFTKLITEIRFWSMLRLIEEVPNPATGHYTWDRASAELALRDGVIDCIAVSAPYDLSPANAAYRLVGAADGAAERLRARCLKELDSLILT